MTDKYQYGVKNVETDEILTIPTDDQGVTTEAFDPEKFKAMHQGKYTLTRRPVGEWEDLATERSEEGWVAGQ